MSNYSLQRYKGTATRHTCPNCGDRRSFAYYVDEQGTPLHPSVGRCNHESGCGYHYTPKQYFQEHPECHTAKDFSFGGQRMKQPTKQPSLPLTVCYIPTNYVEKSQSVHSNFFRFLSTLLTAYYSQCLFGEHLLKSNPGKVVVLVESEKSAVIGSAIFPGYVWLATGGKSQMREEKLRALTGQTVLLFPDVDGYAEWKQRAGSMTFCRAIVSDIIERNATPKQRADHIDIADWIIYQIQEGKLMCTSNHLVEAEKILQRMIEKNPVLQKLIDDLDLVLVGASPIGSSD